MSQTFANAPIQLYIGNLNCNTSENDLRDHFELVGSVVSINIPVDVDKRRGFGFVTVQNVDVAQRAISQLNGSQLQGCNIRVQISNKQKIQCTSDDCSEYTTKQIEIMEQIQIITESELITEKEKERKIKDIFEQLKKKNLYQNELYFTFRGYDFIFLLQQINDCNNINKRMYLDEIEYISEIGVTEFGQNIFFNIFQYSGLLNKVQQLIQQKVGRKKKSKKIQQFSIVIEQLVRIFLMIMMYKKIDLKMIDICVKVLDKNFTYVLKKLKNIGKTIEKIKIKIKNELLGKKLIRIASVIQIAAQFKDEQNLDWSQITKIPDWINQFMIQRVSPLMHINCPIEIHCPLCIKIPNSFEVQQLQKAVYNSFDYISYNNSNFKDYLVNSNNILLHLAFSIVQFTDSSHLNNQTYQNEQCSSSLYSPQFISSSINLLNSFIKSKFFFSIIIIRNLLSSLISLMNYKLHEQMNLNEQKQSLQIRKQSRQCLSSIYAYEDKSHLILLSSYGYAKELAIAICTSVGFGEESDEGIAGPLLNIRDFFNILHKRKYYFLQVPPHPELILQSAEQFEEVGCIEEIEAHLFTQIIYGSYSTQAKSAKDVLFNFFKDQSKSTSFMQHR